MWRILREFQQIYKSTEKKKDWHTFVEIQIVPPLHGRDVTEPNTQLHRERCIKTGFYYQDYVPHVGDFVALNGSNIFLGLLIRTVRIEQESARTTCDQTPVLHSSCVEITSLEGLLTSSKATKMEILFTTRVSSLGRGYSTSKTFS